MFGVLRYRVTLLLSCNINYLGVDVTCQNPE